MVCLALYSRIEHCQPLILNKKGGGIIKRDLEMPASNMCVLFSWTKLIWAPTREDHSAQLLGSSADTINQIKPN